MNKLKMLIAASAVTAAVAMAPAPVEAITYGCQSSVGSVSGSAWCEGNNGHDPDRVRVRVRCYFGYYAYYYGPWVTAGPYWNVSFKACPQGWIAVSAIHQVGA